MGRLDNTEPRELREGFLAFDPIVVFPHRTYRSLNLMTMEILIAICFSEILPEYKFF